MYTPFKHSLSDLLQSTTIQMIGYGRNFDVVVSEVSAMSANQLNNIAKDPIQSMNLISYFLSIDD